MKMTQADFEKLITDVEKEFDLFLAKAESEAKPEESMAKSEDKAEDKPEEKKEESKEEAKEEAKEDSAKADDKEEEKKDDEDKHDYDEEDMEEMHKMYSSMSKGELKAHREAVEKSWMHKCGDMQVAKSEQHEEEQLKKSEEVQKVEQEIALTKSELEAKTKELEGAKKENEDLKKSVEELVGALNGFVTKKGPTRKAVTSVEYIKKSETEEAPKKELNKSEITAILKKKAADPSLSKSDREAINQYYLKGASLDTVKHLLT